MQIGQFKPHVYAGVIGRPGTQLLVPRCASIKFWLAVLLVGVIPEEYKLAQHLRVIGS
jgi:hypothetical protein